MRVTGFLIIKVVLLAVLVNTRPSVAQSSSPLRAESTKAAPQSSGKSANVLILLEIMSQLPVNVIARQAAEREISARASRPITIFDESLDYERFPLPAQQALLRKLIVEKYRDIPIDVIATSGPISLAAARELRASMLPRPGVDSIPIVYTLDESEGRTGAAGYPHGQGVTGIVWASAAEETGRRMRELVKGLRAVAVVASNADLAASLTEELRRGIGDGVQLTPFVSPSPAALRRALAALPQPAAAYYFRVSRDSDGTNWTPINYLRTVAAQSPVPIFSWSPTYLGEGMVGGALRDPAQFGVSVGRIVAGLINGIPVENFPPRVERGTTDTFDWVVLQRYDLATDNLPPGARIIGAPIPLWRQFPRTTAVVSALLLSLSGAVVLLVRNGRRLGQMSRERGQLSRHLLAVQEAERQRIARDLHDDICQEMSAIAVELDYRHSERRQRRADEATDGHAISHGDSLTDRLRVLVERTRRVAHGLHAEPLSYARLAHVLEEEARTLSERHHIRCTVRSDEGDLRLSPAATAGAYRIVMEALTNVVVHASASTCDIEITQDHDSASISITDDGIGFVRTVTGGLGLLSMRERARALGGALHVESEPFRGTRVLLVIPNSRALASAS